MSSGNLRYFDHKTESTAVPLRPSYRGRKMGHHDDYRQWPFLNQEEFELACAFFDQQYVQAKLGPTRKIFKIRSRRVATTGNSYIEILRLLQPPDDADDLSRALEMLSGGYGGLGRGHEESMDVGMIDTVDEDMDQVRS